MTTEFNWSWVNTSTETAKESKAVLQDGGTVFSLRQAYSGQVSGSDLNAFSSSVGQNFQAIRSNWRLYTRPILNSLPAGGSDNRWTTATGKALPDKIDCFKYGVQGTTLFVFNDATESKADGRYWVTDEYRPKTIAEAFEDLHVELSDISDSLNTEVIVDLDPLWAAIGEDYRDSSKVGSSGSLDTRLSTTETYLNQLNNDIYDPSTYSYSLGTPLPYSIALMLDELLQLHNGGGWGSDPSTLSHSPVAVASHTHPHTDIIPGLTQSLTQARVAPYDSLENDILRIRYEIQRTRGSSSWFTDTVDPVGGGAASLAAHIGYTGAGASSSNPHDINYSDTGANLVFNSIRTYTGMESNTDIDPTYSSTTIITQGTNLTTAISQLDTAISNTSFWKKTSSIIEPLVSGDGFSISATGTNTVNISAIYPVTIQSLEKDLILESLAGDVEIHASGTNGGNINMVTNGLGGQIHMTTNGSHNGEVYIDTTGSDNGRISLIAGGTGTNGNGLICLNANYGLILTNADLSEVTGSIISIAEESSGSGRIIVTTSSANIHNNDSLTISGTTNYDDTYTVEEILSDTEFIVTAPFVATETGTWTIDKNVGDDGPAFLKIGDESTNEAVHLYSAMSDILIETGAASCTTDIILRSCDDISLTATGEVDIHSNFSSQWNVIANAITTESLHFSCVNTGAGSGKIYFVSDIFEVTSDDSLLLETDNHSIVMETDAVLNSNADLNLNADTDIKLTATSALSLFSGTNILIQLTSNTISDQQVYIGSSNTGTGRGLINLDCDFATINGDDEILLSTDNTSITLDADINLDTGSGSLEIDGTPGVSGSFTTVDSKTVTVVKGIITSIV